MKKLVKLIWITAIIIITAVFTVSWNGINHGVGTRTQLHPEFRGKTNVLQVTPAGNYGNYVLSFNLHRYTGQRITIEMSMQAWVNTATIIVWQVNTNDWPAIAVGNNWNNLNAGQWHTVQGSNTVTVGSNTVLYLSSMQFGNATAYFADLVIKINGEVVSIDPVIDNSLPALHTKWPFRVGASIKDFDSWEFINYFDSNNPQNALLRHFNALSTENTLLPELVMSEPWTPNGAYRWTRADAVVNYAQAHGLSMRGHGLFWHEHTPEAFFKGSGRDGWATIDEIYTRMENHTRIMFQKYGGKIESWNVVNETVGDNGQVRAGGDPHAQPKGSRFTQIMENGGKTGMDRYEWILKAFQFARRYADANGGQNVKLYILDYDIEFPGAKQTEFLRLLDWLIANNAPIDGVGIQGHIEFTGEPSAKNFGRAIDAFTAKRNPITGQNLKVQVTELDISLFSDNEVGNKRTLTDRELNTRLTQQARRYRELFNVFEQKHREGKLDLVIIWGIDDLTHYSSYYHAWGERTDHAVLFDRNFQPKPAFHELIRGR